MTDSTKPVVLITGCSSGIGRALALELARKDYLVFATARRPESIDDLAGESVFTLPLDVTESDSINAAVNSVMEKAGRIDMLINNAGFGLMGPVSELPLDDFRAQLETNVTGPLALVQAVTPHMVSNGGGTIVNIGSVSGVLTTPFSGAYCASKAALHSLSDAMRMELAPFGIKVVTVQPGGVESRFGDNAADLLKNVLKPGSLFEPVTEYIKKRAGAGQAKSMKADLFAKEVAKAICCKNPRHLFRLGPHSFKLPAYKWGLPTKLVDEILSKMFGLNKLGKP